MSEIIKCGSSFIDIDEILYAKCFGSTVEFWLKGIQLPPGVAMKVIGDDADELIRRLNIKSGNPPEPPKLKLIS